MFTPCLFHADNPGNCIRKETVNVLKKCLDAADSCGEALLLLRGEFKK